MVQGTKISNFSWALGTDQLVTLQVVWCRRPRSSFSRFKIWSQKPLVEYVRPTRIVHGCAVNQLLSIAGHFFFRKRSVRIVLDQLVEEDWDSAISCLMIFKKFSTSGLYFELLGWILAGIGWFEDWGMLRPRWRWITLIQPWETFFEPHLFEFFFCGCFLSSGSPSQDDEQS